MALPLSLTFRSTFPPPEELGKPCTGVAGLSYLHCSHSRKRRERKSSANSVPCFAISQHHQYLGKDGLATEALLRPKSEHPFSPRAPTEDPGTWHQMTQYCIESTDSSEKGGGKI